MKPLLLQFIDMKLRKQHATFTMVRVWQGQKAFREQVLPPNLLGTHRGQFFPAHAGRKLDPHPLLNRLAPRHSDVFGCAITQIVAGFEQLAMTLHNIGLRRSHSRSGLFKILGHDNGRVTAFSALLRTLIRRVDRWAEDNERKQRGREHSEEEACAAFHRLFSFLLLIILDARAPARAFRFMTDSLPAISTASGYRNEEQPCHLIKLYAGGAAKLVWAITAIDLYYQASMILDA